MGIASISDISNYNVAKALLAQGAFNTHQSPNDVKECLARAITASERFAAQAQQVVPRESMTPMNLLDVRPERLANDMSQFT